MKNSSIGSSTAAAPVPIRRAVGAVVGVCVDAGVGVGEKNARMPAPNADALLPEVVLGMVLLDATVCFTSFG